MSSFDDLIREGRDTDAMRLFAKEYYDNRMMGHTRRRLCERVADENDKLQAELALLRKLAQATWEYFNDPEIINDADIEDALAEYEAWKEEADD